MVETAARLRYLEGLEDEGSILRDLRDKRLAQMKQAHSDKIENLQKGHGRYHEICQDDFLNDVLKSKNTLVHFYHTDFENCKVIDHHLAILVARRAESDAISYGSRRRRRRELDIPRGDESRRGHELDISLMNRGAAAAARWIVRGTRRCRGTA